MSGLSPGYVTYHPPGPIRLPNNKIKLNHPGSTRKQYRQLSAPHIMEDNSIGAEPFRTGGPSPWTEHLCGPGEACCPDAVCWRAPSHERGHDRFVLRPSSNHPCCTCASSSDSSARGASHGNACHASHSKRILRRPQGLRSRHSSSFLKPRHERL